jgi:hypothetical protein
MTKKKSWLKSVQIVLLRQQQQTRTLIAHILFVTLYTLVIAIIAWRDQVQERKNVLML